MWAGDFEPFDEPCEMTGDPVLARRMDHYWEAAIACSGPNFEVISDCRLEKTEPLGGAVRVYLDHCTVARGLVGDDAPAFREIEVRGPVDGGVA